MPLELITDIAEFKSLEQDWNKLTDESLRSFDWHYAWWKNFGDGQELKIFAQKTDGKLTGVFPLFVDRWLGQSRVRLIGSGATCTDYAQLIGDQTDQSLFAQDVASELVLQGHDMIEFEGVTPDGLESVVEKLSGDGYWNYQKELEPTWILDLPESWQAFLSGSKKSLKRKIKKADSRLRDPMFRVESSQENLGFEQAFEILVKLHQDRFTSMGKPGVFADEKFHQFLEQAAGNLHTKNKSEILVAFHDDSPLIAQIYLHHPNGPMLYQQGILSEKMNLEPGHLLLTYAVRRAIDRGFTKFDMLRGSHAYKPYWGAHPVDNVNVRLVSRRMVPSTVNRSYQALRSVKHFFFDLAKAKGTRFDKSA